MYTTTARLGTALCLTVSTLVLPLAVRADASTAPQCTTTTTVLLYDNHSRDGWPTTMPSTASGDVNCWMARGDFSTGVGALQKALNDCNPATPRLKVDDDYGLLTQSAVHSFQQNVSITADGVYGGQTRDAMYWPADVDSALCLPALPRG